MAIDKEHLLQYYQTHYLSRREVLFKLPLNLSIETFWPELLRRRKADATILPLSNAMGKPYWFVLTDRMVTASKQLCEEALCHEKLFDPYRAPMTSAMTEEMFFTSFVEGASMQLQEAMDFLQRGTEPESIYEQMIWNNRQAHSNMMRSIYKPLDENQVKNLAFTLTDGMDSCAEDYRQTDGHPIIAMGTENYEVPSAAAIPERMREYYDFLAQPDVHPLIKAAIGQAYLLVCRPFPEGNERLSRMISFAVLLRSGYDFFRDISISSTIALESYSYYKAMCEILRPENGSDLTYFVEYYLELLVRALNNKKDRDRKKEEDSLASERELAEQPLRRIATSPPVISNNVNPDASGFISLTDVPGREEEKDVESPAAIQDMYDAAFIEDKSMSSLEATESPPDFETALMSIPDAPRRSAKELITRMRTVIAQGRTTFTSAQWAIIHDLSGFIADRDCRYLYKYGILDHEKRGATYIYSIRFDQSIPRQGDVETAAGTGVPVAKRKEYDPETFDFWNELSKLERSSSKNRQHIAKVLRDLIEKGIMTFTSTQWKEYAAHDMAQSRRACDLMLSMHLVVNIGTIYHAVYRITLDYHGEKPEESCSTNTSDGRTASRQLLDMTRFVYDPGKISTEYICTLKQMASKDDDPKSNRIGTFLLKRIRGKQYTFSSDEWKSAFAPLCKSALENDLRISVNLGLIKKLGIIHGNRVLYGILPSCNAVVRGEHLNQNQKDKLRALYDAFGTHRFTINDVADVFGKNRSSFEYHLNNFVSCGIISSERIGCLYFTFKVTPQDHPECFGDTKVTMIPAAAASVPSSPIHSDVRYVAAGY